MFLNKLIAVDQASIAVHSLLSDQALTPTPGSSSLTLLLVAVRTCPQT